MSTWSFGYGADGRLEEEIPQACESGMDFVEFGADLGDNALETFDDERVRRLRRLSETCGLQLAIHTASSVNIAEVAPFFRDAVAPYLEANIDLADRLGCSWVVVHGGYHFSSREGERREAAIRHLQRAGDLAEERGVRLVLENHNREPDHAELRYIPYTAHDQAWFLERLRSPALQWSFNIGHANLVPEGVDGFLAAIGVERLGQIRLCDNDGEHEAHLPPGAGTVDFDGLFAALAASGWQGPCVLAFPGTAERLAARERFGPRRGIS